MPEKYPYSERKKPAYLDPETRHFAHRPDSRDGYGAENKSREDEDWMPGVLVLPTKAGITPGPDGFQWEGDSSS